MKNALARCFLAMFVLLQVTFPIRAYAVAPIAVAAAVSVTAHGALLLLKLSSLSRGSSSSSSGGGGNDTGGMIVRLDGNTTTPVPGWDTKTASDGKTVPVPKPSASLKSEVLCSPDGSKSCAQMLSEKFGADGRPPLGYPVPGNENCFYYVPNNNGYTAAGCGPSYGTKVSCPTGYVVEGSACKLASAADVKKPDGVKCEPVFRNGKFEYDRNNPSCDGKNSQQEENGCQSEISAGVYKLNCVDSNVNVSSSEITYQTPQGSGTVPVSVVDGALTITVPADKPMQFPGGFLPVTVDQTGTYSCDSYGLCVPAGVSSGGSSSGGGTSGGSTGGTDTGTGSSSGGSSGSGSSGSGSSGGSGTGSGDGSGTGSGTGSGAGTSTGNNQTALDDSAFQGMGDKAGKAGADGSGSDDGAYKDLRDGVAQKLGFLDGFGFNWVPVPRDFAQCKPIPYAILGLSSSWDFCPYVSVLSQVMGYLFYVFTAVYLYRLFTSSSKD